MCVNGKVRQGSNAAAKRPISLQQMANGAEHNVPQIVLGLRHLTVVTVPGTEVRTGLVRTFAQMRSSASTQLMVTALALTAMLPRGKPNPWIKAEWVFYLFGPP
jgi:UDP-N-acetylmuramyl tripeptide synthase